MLSDICFDVNLAIHLTQKYKLVIKEIKSERDREREREREIVRKTGS